VWFVVKNKKEMFVKQIAFIVICAVLSVAVTACSRSEASGSRGEAKPQTQTESETPAAQTSVTITADSYTKILNGDLSDFTGTNVHNREFISTIKQPYFIRSNTDLEGYVKREMEILKLDTNPYTAIEMIGWSNNGLFAYRTKHLNDSGMWGGWIYSLVIIDTVTDEIIERERFIVNTAIDQDDAKNLNATLLPEGIYNEISKEYIAKWNAILRNHKISGEVGNPIAGEFVNNLLKFPINNYNCWFDDPEYTFEKYKYKSGDEVVEFKKDVYNWILIIGNENIQKKISEGKDELYSSDMPNINGRRILGYYKSPYENRIIVVTIYYDWVAFSGGYHTVKLDLFGCNMNVGLSR